MGLNSLVFGRCCGEWGRRIEAQHTHFLTQSNPNHHRGRIRGVPGLPATPPPHPVPQEAKLQAAQATILALQAEKEALAAEYAKQVVPSIMILAVILLFPPT